jgi:hypothetical protein
MIDIIGGAVPPKKSAWGEVAPCVRLKGLQSAASTLSRREQPAGLFSVMRWAKKRDLLRHVPLDIGEARHVVLIVDRHPADHTAEAASLAHRALYRLRNVARTSCVAHLPLHETDRRLHLAA